MERTLPRPRLPQTFGSRARLAAAALLAALAACSRPVPPDKADYVGHWVGEGAELRVDLQIHQEGRVDYRKTEGRSKTTINAPIKAFRGNDFIVGVGPIETTFVVAAPPRREGERWQMTVDGLELVRQP